MNHQCLSLLVVEDERSLSKLWAMELGDLVEATLAYSLAEARERLKARAFDAILLDLHLPDGNGLELLGEVVERGDPSAVIILTGHADLDSAIQALRLGAYDFLLKPCKIGELEQRLLRIARQQSLANQNLALRQQLHIQRIDSLELIGKSPALTEARNLIGRAGASGTSVLIEGETGTGKEVAARLVHANSSRKNMAFVPVNCASLPREMAESELFGHRKGAFSGAETDRRGLVQTATGGTLFLDEVADIPLEVQAKFLRLLESNEGRRAGDSEAYRTDVRIVAATHRNLRQAVTAGRFREDLFYRLASFEIKMPNLRAIQGDIPAIAQHLLDEAAVMNASAKRFSTEALDVMRGYGWPGNVRELRNVVERAKILCDSEEIGVGHLNLPAVPTPAASSGVAMTLAEMEWGMIQTALRTHGGNKTAAARSLGISLRTLYNKLETKREPTAVMMETPKQR